MSTPPARDPDADPDDAVLREEIERARRTDGALGELFERLTAERGREEASRLWLRVFSESDASET